MVSSASAVVFLQGVNFAPYEAYKAWKLAVIFLLEFVILLKSNNRWVYFLVSFSLSSDF